VSNNESGPISFQLSSFAWTENAQGAIALATTDEIIFFPQLFTIAAGEQRKIRVGVSSGAVASEKAYRLLLAQLPAVETKDHTVAAGIQILTEVSIPIFVQPLQEERAGAIDSMAIVDRNLSFQVRNSGNVHFTIESLTISGLTGGGAPAFSRKEKGWYVLAADNRSYSIPLSAAECGNASSIEVSIKTEDYTLDKSLIQRLPTSAQACDATAGSRSPSRIPSTVGANPISSN
jgi:fimbrial chaperone protein